MYKIELVKDGNQIGFINIKVSRTDNPLIFSIFYSDTIENSGNFTCDDLFLGLSTIRGIYDQLNIKLLCEGSMDNVYPGGLASEESQGEIAYKYNKYSNSYEQVNIFKPVDITLVDHIVTSDTQKENRRQAIRNL